MSSEPDETSNLERIPREPMRFELMNAFRDFSENGELSITDPETLQKFIAAARDTLQGELKKETMLSGHIVQSMFGDMVASLGKVQLVKEEDQGGGASLEELRAPDYFLVLKDGRRLLVEVKSHFQKRAFKDFTISAKVMLSLKRYASLFGADLYFAVYLVRWNQWMLVPAEAFEKCGGTGRQLRLSMSRAGRANDMRLLGDMTIGTTPPLSWVIEFDTTIKQPWKDKQVMLRISGDYLTAAGKRIEDPVEARIARYFMFYGNWEGEEQEVRYEGDKLASMEMPLLPPGDPEVIREQGFAFVGSLSSMFSSYYLSLITNKEGKRHRLSAKTKPGVMGRLIPEPYKGKVLHLWRVTLVPSWPQRDEEPTKDVAVLE